MVNLTADICTLSGHPTHRETQFVTIDSISLLYAAGVRMDKYWQPNTLQ